LAEKEEERGGQALMQLLFVKEITKEYDGVRALDHVSLGIEERKIKGLIGPNGAGKSTLFHLISGMERTSSGKITFDSTDITSMETHQISALGVGRTFQTIQTFGNMTVVENIMVGMHRRLKGRSLSCGLWLPTVRRTEKEALKEAKEILEFLGLLGRWEWPASQLTYAEQKMLEIGRALAMKPKLLLLDEPGAGLTPKEVQLLAEIISKVRQEGITIFLVEHHMGFVMEVADEIAVLHNGRLIAEGIPEEVKTNPQVIEAYLAQRSQDQTGFQNIKSKFQNPNIKGISND
jgi:branched-chain amino acid transport system ATP-binding protein